MNLKREQDVNTILLIASIAVLIGGTAVVKITGHDDLIGVIGGLSGVWIGISSTKLYQIKKKPKKYENQIVGQYDERSIAIRGYAGYATFITTLLTIGITSIIFLFLDYTLSTIFGVALLLNHAFSFLIFTRYYGKKL